MNHPLESAPGQGAELVKIVAPENAQHRDIGIEDLLVAVRAVDKKAAGHLIQQLNYLLCRILPIHPGACQ